MPGISFIILLAIVVINYPSQLLSSDAEEFSEPVRAHCDSDICDSLVSKCRLTDRCSCDFRNDARCAKTCIDCLEEKFGKCCGCVDLCPVAETENHSSHVGETSIADQKFFEVLTETDDIHGRWSSETLLASHQVSHPEYGQLEFAYRSDKGSAIVSYDTDLQGLNCTVAFINRQISMTKCKRSCTTMGASFFRWFHIGCCECVGNYCLNYGIDMPKCRLEDDQ